MSDSRGFVDTNVVVYAHDITAGERRDRARALIAELWESGAGCLSVQVLQEFFVTVTTKVPKPLDAGSAASVIYDLSRWRVHTPAPEDVLAAIDIHAAEDLSFWDSMIIRSAVRLGCDMLYSEDLNPGQEYAGVRVQNPFAA